MWESIAVKGGVGVDRENKVVRGYVIAQEGRFKTQGRGQFDAAALQTIVELGNSTRNGLKSRLSHPTLSADGIGKFLGRARNLRMDSVNTPKGPIKAVRGDLHLDPTAFKNPNGNIGQYVLDLASSDPDAFSSSLVLRTKKEQALDADGNPARDEDGTPHPPLWRPTELHASDVVDTGDAVDGFLSQNYFTIDGLPDSLARHAAMMLDDNFGDMSRDELSAKIDEYKNRYLAWRYGEEDKPSGKNIKRRRDLAIRARALACGIDIRI